MNIPPQQDAQAVKDLKEKNIKCVIFSNHVKSQEERLGEFGGTNSPLLAKYLQDNFHLVQEFGTWDQEPGWIFNHGIRILRRK